MRADICPSECPNRSMLCHSTCQRYLRAKITNELELRRARRKKEELRFYRDERRVVKARKIQKRKEAMRRGSGRKVER
jgi:hypothetical protein